MTKGRTDQEKGLTPPPETAAPGAAMSSSSMRNLLGTNHPSLKPNLKSKNCPLSNKMSSVSISSSSVSAMMAEELNLIHNGYTDPRTRFRISKVQIRCRKCKARHAITKLNALQYQIRNGDATKIVALSNDKIVWNFLAAWLNFQLCRKENSILAYSKLTRGQYKTRRGVAGCAEVAVLCLTKSGEVLNYQAFSNSNGFCTVAETMPESDRWDACLARPISSFHDHYTHHGDTKVGIKFTYNLPSGYSHTVRPFLYQPIYQSSNVLHMNIIHINTVTVVEEICVCLLLYLNKN